MKKLLAVTGALLIAYVIFSAAYGGGDRAAGTDHDIGNGVVYVMREENNRVVVYRSDVLWLKTDTQVSSLPKSDRTKLRNGITVYSDRELKSLIEDYCS